MRARKNLATWRIALRASALRVLARTAKIATIEDRDAIPCGQVAPDVRAGFLARIAERLGMSL